jgi:hypothetical protein
MANPGSTTVELVILPVLGSLDRGLESQTACSDLIELDAGRYGDCTGISATLEIGRAHV